ncbi:ribosome biogenesis GTP-binding protein YihA/YsxC [Hydrogenimonas urashimensis]|uniref:ribosome biogenesis GTP-binding protein YihA/YsxC n=1 Tax=Hydrogenimonas urashimensis TaxID=2740515 RepID=UPI001915763F|nr:ribosome biogenesis GTP-binding protein YihA/YsxC [Hydrogenimonas urashimensis]
MAARIVDASFITSASRIEEAPAEGIGEVVFLGRSNVGKSSLLNSLTHRKHLAKSSSTPGKTRLINYFDIVYKEEETQEKFRLHFVDLPGFGYAKVSKSMKHAWQKSLNEFIRNRRTIRLFVHLRDARHPDVPIDEEVKSYIASFIGPDQCYIEIFTKSDKLNQKERGKILGKHPGAILVSNLKKQGIERVEQLIFDIVIKGKPCL